MLDHNEAIAVAEGERQRNVFDCDEGYDNCDRAKLTAAETRSVDSSAKQRNFSNCDSGLGRCELAQLTLSRVTGYCRSHRKGETTPDYRLNHARSVSDTRTASTSPLRNQSRRSEASPILPSTLSYFHEISRAAGPN
jgi:hypothetical protein